MLYYVLHMSSIERRFIAWLSRSPVDQVSRYLELESFKDDPNADASPANLGILAVFGTFHKNAQAVGEGVDGVKIIGPIQNASEQPLESHNPMDDQTPPE